MVTVALHAAADYMGRPLPNRPCAFTVTERASGATVELENVHRQMALGNEPFTPPARFYMTDAFTDYALGFLDDRRIPRLDEAPKDPVAIRMEMYDSAKLAAEVLGYDRDTLGT